MSPYRTPHVPPSRPRGWYLRNDWRWGGPVALALALIFAPLGREIGSLLTGSRTPWKIQIATAILAAALTWCAGFVRYGGGN